MKTQFRSCLKLLTATMTFFCMVNTQAAPIDMSIVSGSAWRSASSVLPNWVDTGFDDSAWSQAYAPYPNDHTTPADIAGEPTGAALMWHWSEKGEPIGTNGSNEAWFRYTFNLALTTTSLPIIAQALIIADDEFELFINGALYNFGKSTLLSNNFRSNGQPNPLLVDFGSQLLNGTNVLAIHAADNSLANPRDKSHEYVFFDGRITTVPEPGTVILLLFGLLTMVTLARRRQ